MMTMLGKAAGLAARAVAKPRVRRLNAAKTDLVSGEYRGFITETKWHRIPTLRKKKLQARVISAAHDRFLHGRGILHCESLTLLKAKKNVLKTLAIPAKQVKFVLSFRLT